MVLSTTDEYLVYEDKQLIFLSGAFAQFLFYTIQNTKQEE